MMTMMMTMMMMMMMTMMMMDRLALQPRGSPWHV
jgi:hypothetical protein